MKLRLLALLRRYVLNPLRHPGWGACLRCGRTWDRAPSHTTMYSESYGMFALCERCWDSLRPHERIPFYFKLYCRNNGAPWTTSAATQAWLQIEEAVLMEGSCTYGWTDACGRHMVPRTEEYWYFAAIENATGLVELAARTIMETRPIVAPGQRFFKIGVEHG